MTAPWQAGVDALGPRLAAVRADLDAARARLALPDLPWLVAPPVLPASERARIAGALTAVHRALVVVDEVVGEGDARLPLPANARALAPAGDAHRTALDVCRMDALYDAATGDLQLVEVQAGDPSGPGWTDVVLGALQRAGVLAALGVPVAFHSDAHRQAILGPDDPRRDGLVVFACPDASYVVSDHEAMAERWTAAGVPAVRATPKRLVVDAGVVRCDGHPVSLVLRDAPDDLDVDDAHALRRAFAAGVPYANPLRDARFDDKACFALLRAPDVRARCDDATRAAIDAHVPETLVVDDGVRDRLAKQRDAWVLKPATGFGGFGVVVGPEADARAWDDALQASTRARFVAQRAIAARAAPWPVLVDGRIAVLPRFTTWSFWLHRGRMTEAFVRAGSGAVVNVHQGGGLGPVLFAP